VCHERFAFVCSASLAREQLRTSPPVFGGQFPLMARRPRVVEAWEQPARPKRESAIPVGSRVFHQKFGTGTVRSTDDDRLEIEFDKAGTKRLLDSYVELVAKGSEQP